MPFTLSHAAAALPFRKFKPIWSALVIGTFAPDLQYFILLSDEDRSGHHFPEVVLFTLPLALLLLWVFEGCVKVPVVELLPTSVQRRLQDKVDRLSFQGWQRFASIVLWIAIGITTHLIWDSFTHRHDWMVEHWSLLRDTVPVPFLHPMPVDKILQYASTVLGLLALLVWFAYWFRKTAPVPHTRLRKLSSFRKVTVIFIMVVIAVFAGYLLAMFRLADHELPISRSFLVATVCEAITLAFCMQVLVYGLARTYARRPRTVPAVRVGEERG
jgi:hypothetical protein